MMYYADSKHISHRAKAEDEGTLMMIVMVLMTAIISVTAIVQELGVSKDVRGGLMIFYLALTTIVTAWLFIHTMFALHYAHTYYKVKQKHRHHAPLRTQNTKDNQKDDADNPNTQPASQEQNQQENPNNKSQNQADDPNNPNNPNNQNAQTKTPEQRSSETLDFPNEDVPNYWDFLYFSYIIGTSAQTADVDFTSRASRQIGTVHCLLAFFFNTAILALMINMASGLIGN